MVAGRQPIRWPAHAPAGRDIITASRTLLSSAKRIGWCCVADRVWLVLGQVEPPRQGRPPPCSAPILVQGIVRRKDQRDHALWLGGALLSYALTA